MWVKNYNAGGIRARGYGKHNIYFHAPKTSFFAMMIVNFQFGRQILTLQW